MTKIFILIITFFLFFSCSSEEKNKFTKKQNLKNKCEKPYDLNQKNYGNIKIKGVVFASKTNIITSPILGKISYLNCDAGKKVYTKTLITKIIPDYNDPNIKKLKSQKIDLNTQKINLQSQIANLKNNKISTSNSFDIQISNIDSQIDSVKSQIEIAKKNIENIKKTGKVNLNDLDIQINSLKKQIIILKSQIKNAKKTGSVNQNDLNSQIKTLKDSIKKLEDSKKLVQKSLENEITKLDTSKKNLLINIKNAINDNLKIIDENYSLTNINKDTNRKFRDYLSALDRKYKQYVEKNFYILKSKLNNFDKMSDKEISNYLNQIIILDDYAGKGIKNSIDNFYFPKTKIDSLYKVFLNYSNNLSTLKSNFDNFAKSKDIVKTNFENQINSLENQINTSKNNLVNLEKNKKEFIGVNSDTQVLNLENQLKTLESNLKNLQENKKSSIGLSTNTQILNLQSQLKNLESNLKNLYSNKKNLIQNKKTSLSSLENQINQLQNSIIGIETNISNIDFSLSPVLIYSGVNGIIKQKFISLGNKIGPNGKICSIEPDKKNFKIKVYSPFELNIGDELEYEKNSKKYKTKILTSLVSKDIITQNNVYETDYINLNFFKDGEILNLKILNKNLKQKNKQKNIKIPVSYIKNKIDGNFVKTMSGAILVEKKVELGDINGNIVEVKSGIEGVNQICK